MKMCDCDSPLKFIKNIANLYKLIKICVKLENGICYPALESSKGRVPEVFLFLFFHFLSFCFLIIWQVANCKQLLILENISKQGHISFVKCRLLIKYFASRQSKKSLVQCGIFVWSLSILLQTVMILSFFYCVEILNFKINCINVVLCS